jgi:hypothetical protein
MISELPSYNFLRSRALATGLAKALDFVVPRMADVVIADTEECVPLFWTKASRQ